jgi:hypothetical protein
MWNTIRHELREPPRLSLVVGAAMTGERVGPGTHPAAPGPRPASHTDEGQFNS